MRTALATLLVLLGLVAPDVQAQEIQVMAWSAEQSHINIAGTVARFARPDVWAVTRVIDPVLAGNMAVACGSDASQPVEARYEHIEGTPAGGWRTVVLFNPLTMKLRRKWEVLELRIGASAPAPLAAEFALAGTDKAVLVLACDLNRSHRDWRVAEALLLREWVRRQELPVVVAGAIASLADDAPSEVFRALREGGLRRATPTDAPADAVMVGGRGWSSWAAHEPYRDDIRKLLHQAEKDGDLAGQPVAARLRVGTARADAEARDAVRKEVARLRALVASAPLLDRNEILRHVDTLAKALDD